MAHVHTNKEDRRNDMQDEQRTSSMFIDEVEDLEPEKLTSMPKFDEWTEMSSAEKNLFRDISND